MFVLRMGGVANGVEVFGIPGCTSNILWRAAAGSLEQEGKPLSPSCFRTIFRA